MGTLASLFDPKCHNISGPADRHDALALEIQALIRQAEKEVRKENAP